MELLNRSLRALQGIYDDPMLPTYQKGGLEMSEESEDEGEFFVTLKILNKYKKSNSKVAVKMVNLKS